MSTTMDTVVLSDNVPRSLLNALYRYYEQPANSMAVGEMYMLLKLVVSKLEDEMEKVGKQMDVINNLTNESN